MEKQIAVDIQQRLLKVVSELSDVLLSSKDSLSESEYEIVKRSVGLSIGEIQVNLLDFLCIQYPEIDHLSKLD